jgi:hypothetical protein
MVYGLDIKPFFNFWEEKVALKELNYEELELLNIKFSDENKLKFEESVELSNEYGRGYRSHPENPGYLSCLLAPDLIKAEFKLKGGTPDHHKNNRNQISMKIRIKDSLYLGMSKFSISSPSVRNFLNEWFFHKLNRHLGLISLKFNFINVVINDVNKGVYAIEENLDQQLIINNNRSPGVIFRFNPDYIWQESKRVQILRTCFMKV